MQTSCARKTGRYRGRYPDQWQTVKRPIIIRVKGSLITRLGEMIWSRKAANNLSDLTSRPGSSQCLQTTAGFRHSDNWA